MIFMHSNFINRVQPNINLVWCPLQEQDVNLKQVDGKHPTSLPNLKLSKQDNLLWLRSRKLRKLERKAWSLQLTASFAPMYVIELTNIGVPIPKTHDQRAKFDHMT